MREANAETKSSRHHPSSRTNQNLRTILGQGRFVAVCIWLPRNTKGEFTDAATVAREIRVKGYDDSVIGHVSLVIYEPKNNIHEYVSFWPSMYGSILRPYDNDLDHQ